jgi:hypothetical protein
MVIANCAGLYGRIMNAKSAYSAIYGAWLTGFVIGALTLIQTGAVIFFADGGERKETVLAFASVAILFALSYGVWRRNKVCAVLLALYFVLQVGGMAISWIQSRTAPAGILLYFIAMSLCLNGARGVFAHHRFTRIKAESL